MNVHVLQHVPFEGIGSMECWLADQNANTRYTRFYESTKLPDPRQIDLVIAMGGPMSVNDEREHPWLASEKEFIRQSTRFGLPVIGICLGAQLIANALGARVYPGSHTEIGWFPVEALDTDGDVFQLPSGVPVFQWHRETFDLPAMNPNCVTRINSTVVQQPLFLLQDKVVHGLTRKLATDIQADAQGMAPMVRLAFQRIVNR